MYMLIILNIALLNIINSDAFSDNPVQINCNLPISTIKEEAPANISILCVSEAGIYLNNLKTGFYEDVYKIPHSEANPSIANLEKALIDQRIKEKELFKKNIFKDTGNILIKMDQEVPFSVLNSIINTCANADYRTIFFATNSSSIKMKVPNKSIRPALNDTKKLQVAIIASDSFISINNCIDSTQEVQVFRSNSFDTIRINKSGVRHFDILKAKLNNILKGAQGHFSVSGVIIACGDNIKYQFVISIMEHAILAGFTDFNISKLRGENRGGKSKRSKENVQKTVIANIKDLRNLYWNKLKENPKLAGNIYARFAINENGKVIFTGIDSSTVKDTVFEKLVLQIVETWDFGHIDAPGDITEVMYPFVFNK